MSAFIGLILIIGIILFPQESYIGCLKGLSLSLEKVTPSIFPFMIAVKFLLISGTFDRLCSLFSKIGCKSLFSSQGFMIFLLGNFGGFPLGASAIADTYKNGSISKKEAEVLLGVSNGASFSFSVSMIGLSLINSLPLGIILYLSQLSGAFTSAYIIGNQVLKEKKLSSLSRLSPIDKKLSFSQTAIKAITESASNMINIIGFITFFAAITQILKKSGILTVLASNNVLLSNVYSGFFEVTRAIQDISSLPMSKCVLLPVISIVLNLSGLCVFFQVQNMISCTNLSLKYYLSGKILSAIFASSYCILMQNAFNKKEPYLLIALVIGLVLFSIHLMFRLVNNQNKYYNS